MPNLKRGMMGAAGVSAEGGKLFVWGAPISGQLGDSQTAVHFSSPIQVGSGKLFTDVANSPGTFWAIENTGALWAWGLNNDGKLMNGNVANTSSPIQVGSLTDWSSLGAGKYTFLAVKTDGTLWAGGSGSNGVQGRDDVINRSSPVQVGSLTNWSSVSAHSYHSVAIKTDGTLWCWGNGTQGQLGFGDKISTSSPVQLGANTWTSVSTGPHHTLLVRADGTAWHFGQDGAGRGGHNAPQSHKSSPVQIGSLTNWSKISTGSAHCIALKTDGTLWGWGRNTNGAAGVGTVLNISSPTQIGSLDTWAYVNAGYSQSLAIKTDGTLWAWGDNEAGGYRQLPTGNVIKYSSPVQIGSETDWLGPIAHFNRESGGATKTG